MAQPDEPMFAETAYLFRHAVVRDAAYGLQPPSERALLHGLALDILEALPGLNLPPIALELARHARAAHEGGIEPGRYGATESRYLRIGGDFARFNYDYPAAMDALQRLYSLLADDPPARAIAADMLADVLQRLGRWTDSLPCFEEVRAHAANPEMVGRALVHLAWAGIESDRPVDELVAEGEAIAETCDSHRLRIAFMMVRAHRMSHAGDHAAAAREMQAVIDYAERTDDLGQQVAGHANAAQYETEAGNPVAARAHLDAAERLCAEPRMRHHRAGILRARANAATRSGDFETALRCAREAAAIGAETGGRGLLAGSLCETAVALTGLQRHLEAFDTLQQARELIAETADTLLAVSWLHAYAGLMRAWYKASQAVPVFEEGLNELAERLPAQTLESLRAELESLRGS